MKARHFAIVGATGAVGQELLTILQQRDIETASLRLLASERSAGKTLHFRDRPLTVEALAREAFSGVDVAFFSAGASTSRAFAPDAVNAGAVVIDNSSAFRMEPDVPLVVPEINATALDAHRGIVAVPNCTTIILCMVVAPLHRAQPVRRVVASTYQAVSGAGAKALAEFEAQVRQLADGAPLESQVLPYPIVSNLFSHNTPIGSDGYNGEETKVIQETRKILGAGDLPVSATCIRVPIARAHSESVNLSFDSPFDVDRARAVLSDAPGVTLVDDRQANRFPMPVDASNNDDVLVGRIRRDLSDPEGRSLELFCCGDQLRKGAALNAVQIYESFEQRGLLDR